MVKIDKSKTAPALYWAVIKGTLIACALTCIAIIVCALLLTYTELSEKNLPLIITVTCVLSVAVSGFDAARAAKERGWLWGIIAGVIYAAIILCIECIVGGGFVIDSRSLLLTVLSVAGGATGGILGINLKK